jgi:hypothetical protein
MDIYIHIFLTSKLVGGDWSASLPCCFTPSERDTSTYWIGGWVSARADLDSTEKTETLTLTGLEL